MRAHTEKASLPFNLPHHHLPGCCGPCRRERRGREGGGEGGIFGNLLAHTQAPTLTCAMTGEFRGESRIKSLGLSVLGSPPAPPYPHPPLSYKMVRLLICQLAKPQVRNKDHLCTTAPEVTSPAPVNSTMARREPAPWPPTTGLGDPHPHCSSLPTPETFSCYTKNNGTKGGGNTEVSCLGSLKVGKAKS